MSQRKQKHRGMNGEEEDDARSMTSQRSSLSSLSQRSRSSMKKGMKSFGKGIKKVFQSGSPKKRRKKKKGGGGEGDDDAASCGSAASYGSSHSLPLASSPRSPRRNEEWTSPESAIDGGSGPVDVDTVDDNTNTTYDNNSNNSMGGRPSQSRPSRISLPKVVEGDNEDYDSTSDLGSIKNSSSHHKKNKRSPLNVFSNHKKNKNRNSGGSSSVSSRGSRNNRFSPSPIAPTPARKADELSLVILLVDPTSLRFELLSLDFDLATHNNQEQVEQKKNNNKKNKSPRKSSKTSEKNEPTTSSSVSFTVQDVLDQITPESLTEETIKHNLLFKTTPIGLIDRTDQIHLGSASLDAVCSSRPLRNIMDCDFQKRLQMADPNSNKKGPISLSLCDLTYSGTPHRDVLLAYFGTKGDTAAEEDRVRATIALSRPIFTDPNVASLMENNGYDVSGWNGKKVNSISSAAFAAADHSVNESSPLASSTTTDGTTPTSPTSASSRSAATSTTTTTPITTLLGKPLPAKKRTKSSFCTRLVHLLLVLLTVLVASLLAWSLVSGSFYVLPSVLGRTRNSSNSSHPLVTTSSTSTPIRNTSTSTSTSTKAASSYESRATTISSASAADTDKNTDTDTDTDQYYSQHLPHTMEGYLRLGYASISSWMGQTLSQQERKEDTETTTSEDVVVNNDQEEEEVEKEDDTTIVVDVVDDDKENENDRRDRSMDDNDEIIDLDL